MRGIRRHPPSKPAPAPPPPPRKEPDPIGVWVCYHYDFSEVVIFGHHQQVEALQYARANYTQATFVKFGESLREVTR